MEKKGCFTVMTLMVLVMSAVIMLLSGCGNTAELRHCVVVPKDALTFFTPEDEQKLFAVFDINIPENETDVYVKSFSRRYSEFLGSYHEIFFHLNLEA